MTEDADLGIRLARHGFAVQVLDSTTWEEAPNKLNGWCCQRTRWLKGWMQTYLVHTRQPLRLWRELGAWPFSGLQLLMGGLILSALIHPWFYAFAGLSAWRGTLFEMPLGVDGQLLWALGIFNLGCGYFTGVGLGAAAVARRGKTCLILHALMMPIYWLMISLAAYRAMYQLISDPYLWEKTNHEARGASEIVTVPRS